MIIPQSVLFLSRLIEVSGVNQVYGVFTDRRDHNKAMEFGCGVFCL